MSSLHLNLAHPPPRPRVPIIKHHIPNNVVFLLQIVGREGTVARLPGGGRLEEDLISLLTDSILGQLHRPTGRNFLTRYLIALLVWPTVRPALVQAIDQGVRRALHRIKDKTRRVV